MKTKQIKLSVIAALIVIAGIFAFTKASSSEESDDFVIGSETEGSEGESETGDTPAREIVVYICGEVNNPGVYTMETGSRVSDLLGKAGGATADADLKCVNLAKELTDAEQITIASVGEAQEAANAQEGAGATPAVSGNGLININYADKATLMTLPGIGEVRAEAIISYRDEKGSFKVIEDIKKVSGIKDASFQKIKDLITI